MTPQDFFYGTLYVCGGCLMLALSLAVVGVVAVAFVVVAGWLATTFKRAEVAGRTESVPGANGQLMNVVRFPTGQVGTIPADGPQLPPELFA